MSAPNPPADFKVLIPDPSGTLCTSFKNALLKLPVLIYAFINWMLDADGNLTTDFQQAVSDLTVKPGDLIFSAAPVNTDGRLLCNGQVVSRSAYPRLFLAIGVLYGAGDGSSTFQIPDYRARFPVGVGTFESGAATVLGTAVGTERITLAGENFPHTHCFGRMQSQTSGGADDPILLKGTTTVTSGAGRGVSGAGSGIQNIDLGSGTGDFLVTAREELTTSPVPTPISKIPPALPAYIFIKT